jgi:Alpha-acetolactate decarboxylase
MAQQVLHYRQFYAAFHEMRGERMAQKMNATFASHTALFQRAVIDVRPDASIHRFTGFFAEEEPRDVMTCFTLTLRSPVVSAQRLLEHRDFGLGTFANLDGEMVVLDGHVYQVQGTGRVSEALPSARAPFAVVTKFAPDVDLEMEPVRNFSELQRIWSMELRSMRRTFVLPMQKSRLDARSAKSF